MTGAQLALSSGALLALGVVLGAWGLVPAHPDLNDAIDRLSPGFARRQDTVPVAADGRERLGLWGMRHLPARLWGNTPRRELAMLRVSLPRFYGEKIALAGLGLVLPAFATAMFTIAGIQLPLAIPAAATIAFGAGLWFVPNLSVASDARQARLEFNRALGAYVDLVALERNSGAGSRQAMEVAAGIGDSWVFQRVGEELARSRWSGQAPWDALHQLGDELGLPDLGDLADIMRLSGEEGAQIYGTLRARSAAMRTAMLTDEQGKANEVSEGMVLPVSLLGVMFIALLVAPSILRLFASA